MIVGIGVDVVDLTRFERAAARTPPLLVRLFTPAERTLPLHSLAGRFAAKEALIKALGTGFSRDARTLHVGWGDRLEVSDGWRAFQLQALGLSTPAAIAMAGRIGAVHLLT